MNDGRLSAIEQMARSFDANTGGAFPAVSDDGERYLHSSRILERLCSTEEAPPGCARRFRKTGRWQGCGASAWGQPEPLAWPGLPWWVLVAWLGFGGACAAAGALWAARRRHAELQRVRSEQRAWRQLSQQVAWRSDARHCLVEWQAPAGAAQRPAPLAPGQPLAEAFTPWRSDGSAPAWPDCLQAEAAWGPWKLVSRSDQRLWLLSAQPCFDLLGRFGGHVGRARLIEPGEQARRDQALLQRLWPPLGEPALVLDDHSK